MKMDEKSSKDTWDKLDVLARIVSGVLLVAIAVFIKIGTDNIASSMRSGELVQSLIADLTTSGTRRDVALIALNHSVADKNSGLVTDIAERLVWDIVESESASVAAEAGPLYTTAFKILRQRNPERAKEIEREVVEKFLPRESLRSPVDVSKESYKQASPKARLLVRAFQNLVYIQFRAEENKGRDLPCLITA